ncbi:glycoside hydrolase family 104 protein [Halomonas sp. 5021]|uniref:glycoside hydrolase family 24 protein n=1 Tax=Halomonas sp. 5021 TaxID=3082156 RepID=UPI002FCB3239
MPRITAKDAGSVNLCAFLDMLAFAEIGPAMLEKSDDGYDVLVGSLPNAMSTFDGYGDHPLPSKRDAIEYAPGVWSTAAGRYQILSRYWRHYRDQLGLPDFGPVSQDRYAIQQIKEQRAIDLIHDGDITEAIGRCRNIWASLPGADYGQHEHALGDLIHEYVKAGGTLSGEDKTWYERAELQRGGA